MTITCSGETLILSTEKAIYWAERKTLIISDLHLGKAAHFRKHGIPVPATVGRSDLERLSALIQQYEPENLLITGDMFHHKLNSDIADFAAWREHFSSLRILLIKGNHDRLKRHQYAALNIEVFDMEWIEGPFRFIHEPPDQQDDYYTISGHIHPGVTVYGKARQRLSLPCFYFGKNHAVLPAFSAFTGLSSIKPEQGDLFYAITPSRIVAV